MSSSTVRQLERLKGTDGHCLQQLVCNPVDVTQQTGKQCAKANNGQALVTIA